MTVTRVLLASAVLVLLVQFPRLRSDNPAHASLELVVLPLAAMVLFLCGLALSSGGHSAPFAVVVLSGVGGATLALFAASSFVLPPELELALFVLGALSLLSVAIWAFLRQTTQASRSALFIAIGGLLGVLAFLRAAFWRYASFYQTESIGIAAFFYRSLELTVGFGLGGMLLLAAAGFRMASGTAARGASGAAQR